MIPKIIHYCWISNDPYPELIESCIKSWHEYCPDYTIKLWNYDELMKINNLPNWIYTALEDKNYAFISDYIRHYAIYNYGGWYFDSDIILLKPIPEYMHIYDFVGSIETTKNFYGGFKEINEFKYGIAIDASCFGAIKNSKICKNALTLYNTYYNTIYDINKIQNINKINDEHTKYYPLASQVLSKSCEEFGFNYVNVDKILIKNIYLDKRLVVGPKLYKHLPESKQNQIIAIHMCRGSWRYHKLNN